MSQQPGKQSILLVLSLVCVLFSFNPVAANCSDLTVESPTPSHYGQMLVVQGTATDQAHYEFTSETTFSNLQGPGTDNTYIFNLTDRGDTIKVTCSNYNGTSYTGSEDKVWVYVGGASEGESNLALGLIFGILATAAILMYAAMNYGKGKKDDEDDSDQHAPLRIFLMLFSIIAIVVALNLGAGYEATYLTSPDGEVYSGFSGWGGYTLIFVTIAYFLLYTLYHIFNDLSPKNVMGRRRDE